MRLFAFLLPAVLAAAPALADTLATVKERGEIIFGLEAQYKPFEFRDENNEIIGYDIDVATEIGKRLGGVTPAPVDTNWSTVIQSLNNGDFDLILGGMTATEERYKRVNFPYPYMDASSGLLVTTASGIATPADMDGKSVAAGAGTPQINQLELAAEEHDYKSVVIDSLDWLERLIWTQVCADRGVENIEDIGYAKGYTFALTYWREVLIALDWLRNERGMMVILLAHAKIERFENPETEAYDRYSPKLHKLASAVVQEWCDEVLFANYRTYAKTSGEGFDKRAIGVSQGERIIRTTERPAHVAKNRCNLPDELPLDFRAYAAALAS